MEIKRINGVISTYKSQGIGAAKKTSAAASVKNTDRVEFGFEQALQAAKKGIAAEVKADATAQELASAQQLTEQGGLSAAELAGYLFLG